MFQVFNQNNTVFNETEETIKEIEVIPMNIVPAQKDDLQGNPHKKCAEVLEGLIEYGENAISLCLDGKWGSGKTTIANILVNSLQRKKKNKILICNFNAWHFEGYTIRRAFLQKLYNTSKIDDTELKKTIFSKLSVVKVNTWSMACFSLFLTNISSIIFNYKKFEKNNFLYLIIFNAVLCLFFLLINYFIYRKTETEEEIIYDDILFQDCFADICKKAKETKNYTSILIILDDIDRMSKQEQKSVFQILQLLRTANKEKDLHYSFVVPLDSSNIDFKDSDSYFEKCFDYIVPVPLLRQNQMQDYLRKNTETMGFEDDALQEAFDSLVKEKNVVFTVRQIAVLRNQIEVYKRFELNDGNKIKDEDFEKIVFYYCYLKFIERKKDAEILNMKEEQFPKFLLAVADSETLKNQFFNLCYQIKVDSEK